MRLFVCVVVWRCTGCVSCEVFCQRCLGRVRKSFLVDFAPHLIATFSVCYIHVHMECAYGDVCMGMCLSKCVCALVLNGLLIFCVLWFHEFS